MKWSSEGRRTHGKQKRMTARHSRSDISSEISQYLSPVWLHRWSMEQATELDLTSQSLPKLRNKEAGCLCSHDWLWSLSGVNKKVKIRWAKDNGKVVGTRTCKSQLNCWNQIITGNEWECQKKMVTERIAGTWDPAVRVIMRGWKRPWQWMTESEWRPKSLEERK